MIPIQDTIIRPNGDVEVVNVEVEDNYFDAPIVEQSTEKIAALAEIEKATTIASLKAAMLNYIDVAKLG